MNGTSLHGFKTGRKAVTMSRIPETLIILFSLALLVVVFQTDTSQSINYFTVLYDRLLKTISAIIFFPLIAACIFSMARKKSIFSNPAAKNALANGSLLALSFLAMLVFAEFALSGFPSSVAFSEFSAELHHQNKPNFSGELVQPEWKMSVKTNSIGLRGGEISQKTPGKTRILLLGDSFTFGYGVAEGETFGKTTEKKLGEHFEVINAGAISYSPMLEYLQLKKIFGKINPDIVVLNFDMSDVQDDYEYEKEAVSNDGTLFFPQPSPSAGFSLVSFAKNLKTITFLKTSILDPLVLALPVKGLIETDLPTIGKIESDRYAITRENANLGEHWQRTFKYIKKIADYSAEKNVKFILHAYPYGHQVNEKAWDYGRYFWGLKRGTIYSNEPFEKLEKFSSENQITFISSFEAIKHASAEKKLYFDYDGHFNPEGHKVLGDFLAKKIIENSGQ
ncbi:MAG: SGNH/GDSL hydrolase family protein [archaeon]|nr:SGNH/GDSL hydrolase family protein [archaeon]